jgi:hypothetical protein
METCDKTSWILFSLRKVSHNFVQKIKLVSSQSLAFYKEIIKITVKRDSPELIQHNN